MAYTEVFYPKLPMEGCADRIQDVIVRSGFSNGQVSERYRLETPGGSVLVLVLVKYLHRTGSEIMCDGSAGRAGGQLRLHLTAPVRWAAWEMSAGEAYCLQAGKDSGGMRTMDFEFRGGSKAMTTVYMVRHAEGGEISTAGFTAGTTA